MQEMTALHFKDKGQDFTTWIVCNDRVVDCQPFQSRLWVGKIVEVNGSEVYCSADEDSDFALLKHEVEKVDSVSESYSAGFHDSAKGSVFVDKPRFESDEQYRFGVNVAKYNASKGFLHAAMGWPVDES